MNIRQISLLIFSQKVHLIDRSFSAVGIWSENVSWAFAFATGASTANAVAFKFNLEILPLRWLKYDGFLSAIFSNSYLTCKSFSFTYSGP
jgi:hypothetical protein